MTTKQNAADDRAVQLILESDETGNIVTEKYSPELATSLLVRSEGHCEPGAGEVRGDYWGPGENEAGWRVQLT